MARAAGAGARALALGALTAVESGRVSRLDRALHLQGLDPQDRAFARELAQGTERQHLLLDHVLAQLVEKALPKDPELLSVLRLGAYQLLFMAGVQDHAAVHETVNLVRHKKGFVNGVLRNLARRIDHVLPPKDTPEHLAVACGLPGFLVSRWAERLGWDEARQVAEASSTTPAMTLAPTQRSGGAQPLAQRLALEGVTTRPLGEGDMLVWEGGASPLQGQAFAEGWFLVQGPAAAAAVQALAPRPGETVLDLCAAPGTKTVFLAEAVGPRGSVLAFDVDPRRRPLIQQNCERVGVTEWVRVLESLQDVPRVDRVLVDAPCSNTGVMARRLEVRRWISVEAIADLARVQADLLRQGMASCKPGGRVVYSTCSLEPEENQEVVATVLGKRSRLLMERLTLPRAPAGDGGYFAVLETVL